MRRLQIKFPNQIRISGWDFGSSARAMNQAGGNISTQADLRTVRKSTTERKSMSTKTSIKRIALVAVSALGLGVLTSVAPASAAANNGVTGLTVTAQAPFRADVQSYVAITLTAPASQYGGSNTVSLGAKVTVAPSGSSASAIDFTSVLTSGDKSFALDSTAVYGTITASAASALDTDTATGTWSDGSSTTTGKFLLAFTPDVAGTYQILVWANGSSYTAGYPTAVINLTTAGDPASATLTSVATTFAKSAAATNQKGTLVKAVLKDAAGNLTIPNGNQSIDFSQAGAATASTVGIGGTAQSSGSIKSYGASDWKTGTLYVSVDNTAAETITLSAAVSGTASGTLGSLALTSKTVDVDDVANDAVAIPSALSTLSTANTGGYSAASGTSTSTNLSTQTLQATITDPGADVYIGFVVIDTDGIVTGNVGGTIQPVVAAADNDTKAYISISAALGTSTSTSYTIEPIADGTNTASTGTAIEVTGGTAAAHSVSDGTPSVIRMAPAGSPSIRVRVTDQFGGGVGYAAVTVSISGRNALTTITSNYVTDASGYVTATYTDASTSTTSLTDTVTFTCAACSSDTTGTATVTFSSVGVNTVTVTGAASEDVAPSVTYSNIAAGTAGPHGAPVSITATVKDVNGSVLAGVPVTFTLSGVSGAAIQKTASVDYTTVYTDTTGAAVTKVIGWTTGKTTVTATAGGKTGTGYINWKSGTSTANAQAAARVLSGSVNKDIVSLKVVDRFGNPVANAVINLTRTGAGLFGNGSSTQDATTDSSGTADVRFTGTGTVVATLSESYTQAYAAADKVAGVTDSPVAFTAPTAGTTIGTGSTYAPAGVATVSLDVADTSSDSVDAANEATDAANAATDAANAAAEAADAATAAAQDAQAAVAELATKVASLIAGIKAQITTLTNLVIKIQKKVRA